MFGRLLRFEVNVGDEVKANDVVAVVEAMKMHVEVYAPRNGVVEEILGRPEDVVKEGETLLVLG